MSHANAALGVNTSTYVRSNSTECYNCRKQENCATTIRCSQ